MPASHADYVVNIGCYVPVGDGLKYRQPGQVVTLTKKAAHGLEGFIDPLGETPRPKAVPEPPVRDAYADRLQNSDVVGSPLDTPREESDGG